jgi:hypothetical protein
MPHRCIVRSGLAPMSFNPLLYSCPGTLVMAFSGSFLGSLQAPFPLLGHPVLARCRFSHGGVGGRVVTGNSNLNFPFLYFCIFFFFPSAPSLVSSVTCFVDAPRRPKPERGFWARGRNNDLAGTCAYLGRRLVAWRRKGNVMQHRYL